MKNNISPLLILVLLLVSQLALAQNPKSLFKTGRTLFENQKFEEAIPNFTEALKLKPEYEKALLLRAQAYKNTKQYKLAADDYISLCKLEDDEEEYIYEAGENLFKIADYKKSTKYLHRLVELDNEHISSYTMLYTAHFELKEFENAKVIMDRLIELAPNKVVYYTQRATALDSAGLVAQASVDYDKRLSFRADQVIYIAYAKMLHRAKQLEKAKKITDKGIAKFPKTKSLYFIRADAYLDKLEFQQAINDLSKVTVLDNKDTEAYKKRAAAYLGFNQFQAAIGDYGKIISLQPNNSEAYFNRAKTFEEVSDKKSAIRDYTFVLNANNTSNANAKEQLQTAIDRLFELQRETTPPVLVVTEPNNTNNIINVADTQSEIIIKGTISDASALKSLAIGTAKFKVKTNPSGTTPFATKVTIDNASTLDLVATDIYGNVTKTTLTIERNEVDAPIVELLSPFASENGEVFLESNSDNLNIDGKISDESFIQKVTVNGVNASFSPKTKNPKFNAVISIREVEYVEIIATDIFGNKSTKKIHINREDALALSANPMGKTWLVFIENSNYETFSSLEGPQKDVAMMKNALANYQLHNVMHKKDMSKSQMERFFSIELRDLIRSNRVNSLVVWYAGHGKFLNETGYWVPVDAQRDDEFTYFNIGNLKAAMQAYSKDITHTLVITDACESGPSFYQAMRSTLTEKSCNDPQATRFKSSQVFSSAGYELASDNSQFTKSFVKALEINSNSCLPIEKIVKTVTKAAKGNNQQQPQFGRIFGMEDENGTFFFMKK